MDGWMDGWMDEWMKRWMNGLYVELSREQYYLVNSYNKAYLLLHGWKLSISPSLIQILLVDYDDGLSIAGTTHR